MPAREQPDGTADMDAKPEGPTSIAWRPVLVIWTILFTLGFGITIASAPQTRIYEDIICRQYYRRNPQQLTPALGIAAIPPQGHSLFHQNDLRNGPDESRCKVPAIQDAVNELFGWQTFFDGIPGLLLAMYYGSLADRIGRRPILVMSLFGPALGAAYILYICWIEADVRLTWVSSIFSCIGGGNTVFTAAGMMILADATPDSSRSRIFFFASTFLIVGEMLGPPLGAVLMATDPWIPNIIGFLCMALAVVIACLTPETLGKKKSAEADAPKDTVRGMLGRHATVDVWKHAVSTLGFVFRSRNLAVLVATYFTVDFARETLSLIVRYVSARFNIPLAKVSVALVR
jgi:MFS family permease